MDTSPYVPIPLVIYFVFCTNVWVFILFYFNLGLKLGTLVPLHLPLLGFSFFSFLFFCALYYKFVLYITRGVPNKAVEKKKRRQQQQQQQKTLNKEHFPLYLPICNILCQILRFLKGNQGTRRAPNKNKQPCSCQTFLRNLPFHLIQCISLHLKSPDLYLFCKTKVFPKFLLPFESQEEEEEFASYDYAPRSLSLLVACRRMLMQKRPLFDASRSSCTEMFLLVFSVCARLG